MQDATEITIESYNQTAKKYSENTANIRCDTEFERFFKNMPKNSLILDLGCGSGRDYKIFYDEKNMNPIGIDLSQELIKEAYKHFPEGDFRIMDMRDLNFPNNYFKGIWANASLPHLLKEDLPEALEECYRVLEKEEIFYAGFKKGEGEEIILDKRYNNVPKFYAFYQEKEIEKQFENAGFEVLENYILGHDPNATNPWMNIFCKK